MHNAFPNTLVFLYRMQQTLSDEIEVHEATYRRVAPRDTQQKELTLPYRSFVLLLFVFAMFVIVSMIVDDVELF